MVTCAICKKEIPLDEGFFTEGNLDYCEKCYADKRWNEVDGKTRAAWRKNITVWIRWVNEASDKEERKRRLDYVKRLKVPKALETDIDAAVAT